MELSTFANTVGILELLVGLPLVFYTKPFMKWIDKVMKEEPLMRMMGAIITVLGGLVLLEDFRIYPDIEGFVILIAWLVFLKGIVWTWYPQTAIRMKKKWAKNDAALTLGGLSATAIGLLLLYAGMVV